MITARNLLADLEKSIESLSHSIQVFESLDANLYEAKKKYYGTIFKTEVSRIKFIKNQLDYCQSDIIQKIDTLTLLNFKSELLNQIDLLTEFDNSPINFYFNGYEHLPLKCNSSLLVLGFASLIKQLLREDQDQIHFQFNIIDEKLICKISSPLITNDTINNTFENIKIFQKILHEHKITYEINYFQSLIFLEFTDLI